MTRVVIDASAGAEIVTATARGRALARLLPNDAELWVPQHFYVEVLGVLRHQSVIARTISPDKADLAVDVSIGCGRPAASAAMTFSPVSGR